MQGIKFAISLKGALVCCSLLIMYTPAMSQAFHVNTGFTPPVSNLLQQIMQLTFDRVGLELLFAEQPGERSIALVAQGIDDAECCRIPQAIQRDYPELIQVPEAVYTARFSAFAKKPLPDVDGFDSLKPYTVATVSGWKILVNNIRQVQPQVFHVMDNAQAMFQVLQLERIDIATYGYLSGLHTLSALQMENVEVIHPPLASAPLYLFLHKKHKNLLPRFSEAIRQLKQEGEIEQLITRFEHQQLGANSDAQ